MDYTEIEVNLPTTVEGLDKFVADITASYNLPDSDDTYDAIATMIMHLDHRIASAKPSYFGNGVLKQMANLAAYTRLREIADRRNKKLEEEKTVPALVGTEAPSDSVEPLQNA